MKISAVLTCAATLLVAPLVLAPMLSAQRAHGNAVIELWSQGKVAFGIFVPNEGPSAPSGPPGTPPGAPRGPMSKPVYTKEGGERLATNPLYDFVFLNLEGSYDAGAIRSIAEGLRSPKAVNQKSLIVRIPAIGKDGADAARARVKEAFDAGADGVTIPHVENVAQASQAIGLFKDAGANVWSPANPNGAKLAMLMIEDAGALREAQAFADVPGYSILACGIGSLTQALGGDRAAAEAGTQQILAQTKRAKLVNMLTMTTQDVEQRVREGFLGLIAQGQNADEAIKLGRVAAGR